MTDAPQLLPCPTDRQVAAVVRKLRRMGQWDHADTALFKRAADMVETLAAWNRRSVKENGGEWRSIETAPGDKQPCWIWHPTGTMVLAYRDDKLLGVWRIRYTDKLLGWMPTLWMPLPAPPKPPAPASKESTDGE